MADIVDRLNRLSDTLIGLNLDMKLPPNSIDPREAADEIERLRTGIKQIEAAIIETKMPDEIRRKLRNWVRAVMSVSAQPPVDGDENTRPA